MNKFTVKHHFPLTNIEQQMKKTSKSKGYAEFDFIKRYLQLCLHIYPQTCQSFLTRDGIYSPTTFLEGTTNAFIYLQSPLSSTIPPALKHNMLFSLDDILAHASNIEDLVTVISGFFEYFTQYNLKINPVNFVSYTREIRWCGRILSKNGIRFDRRRINGVRIMHEPMNVEERQQFVCALQWMRSVIPTFSTLIPLLSDFMESIYVKAGTGEKSAVARVKLNKAAWSNTESDAFQFAESALEHQVALSHRHEDCRLCVFTDASASSGRVSSHKSPSRTSPNLTSINVRSLSAFSLGSLLGAASAGIP